MYCAVYDITSAVFFVLMYPLSFLTHVVFLATSIYSEKSLHITCVWFAFVHLVGEVRVEHLELLADVRSALL